MKESAEKIVKIGFKRDPKKILNEVEFVSAEMIRNGWMLKDTCIEDGLGSIHLFFERELKGEIFFDQKVS